MRSGKHRWEWFIFAASFIIAFAIRLAPAAIQTASKGEAKFVPIIMYHSLLKDPQCANSYTVSPAVLEADLLYLTEQGYETVVMQDLINYVHHDMPLPKKPVVITFDDGHLNTLTYASPILQKYGARAVVSVVGEFADEAVRQNDPNPQYAYTTWTDLKAMKETGFFEIQNHTYHLHQNQSHKGATRNAGEVLSNYEERLIRDVLEMQQAVQTHIGTTPTTLTYPYGFVDADSERVLHDLGFLATLTCAERGNFVTKDPQCLYRLGRYNRSAGVSTHEFMKKALIK